MRRSGTVLPFRSSKRLAAGGVGQSAKERVLLLQGPVGPFFKKLQAFLNARDLETWRVTFNAGDRLFAGGDKTINFAGRPSQYGSWLRELLSGGRFTRVILFGCSRPVHEVARSICRKMGILVLSLEEGYLRPGLVTMELGGNNAVSPLAGLLPSGEPAQEDPARTDTPKSSFSQMGLRAVGYYLAHSLFSTPVERRLFHKRDRARLQQEAYFWVRNAVRKYSDLPRNSSCIEMLLERYDKRYYFVPLQVSDDSQLGPRFGRGWNNRLAATRLIESFVAHAPRDRRLVFKIHPIDRGHGDHATFIRSLSELHGVADRVEILTSGSVGLMARHSCGMLTINSSAGFSALHHGCPLGVLGKAVYAHPELVSNLLTPTDIDRFWTEGRTAAMKLRHAYLKWIRCQALVRGDYYLDDEFERTASAVYSKITVASEVDKIAPQAVIPVSVSIAAAM